MNGYKVLPEIILSQQGKDDLAFGLLMEVVMLAKAHKPYKAELKQLGKALKESPAAMALAKRCIQLSETQ